MCPLGLSPEPCDNIKDLLLSFKSVGEGEGKCHRLYNPNDPRNEQDGLCHVVVFVSGSIIFGSQQPSFVLKCPALWSISGERSSESPLSLPSSFHSYLLFS